MSGRSLYFALTEGAMTIGGILLAVSLAACVRGHWRSRVSSASSLATSGAVFLTVKL